MNAPADPTLLPPLTQPQGWQASLALRVENRTGRSVLARNQHYGPLRVQKALYPEGDPVCQILMLHPPAGIAGGDQLQIEVEVAADAHAQLTTPGAGKWYKARGVDQPLATQDITLSVAAGGKLEWLPQEVIVFDQAQARATTTINLAEGARAIGWDILCLGRQASGEDFRTGSFRQRLRLQRPDGTPLWQEAMHLQGSDSTMRSPVGLNNKRIFGTLWLAGITPDATLTESLRSLAISTGTYGLSALPQVTIIRAMADSAEAIRQYFEAVWAMARPHVLQREAVAPRIWKT
ncbi:urease accessory protein UreD [Uliginosibacterium aquaticum]|uniref:Urease accessory protein UreD n=1 Tax=Uliginosibacterium aquaticum TaxID=2731212 RepID=A0ABX2ICU4_9RHOO|nr:urease accessory protein UreD [Uliginosibacterium aquaticum]NSL54329.1 urease accessory protein UreD [Uliginosibacterium aquaticum]